LIAENPKLLGIGIDEYTAIIVNPDETFDVIGEKNVVIYNALQAQINIMPCKSIGISDMILHVLCPGPNLTSKPEKL